MNRKNLKDETSKGNFTIKPMQQYEEAKDVNIDSIREGDFVIAKVERFTPPNMISLNVGGIQAQMDAKDYDIYDREKNLKEIYSVVGKLIVARVVSKKGNSLILERKSVVEDSITYLVQHLSYNVEATVQKIVDFGLFVDIGNGISTLVHLKKLSKNRIFSYNQLNKLFKVGDTIKVKLLEYDPQTLQFKVSRKEAYVKLEEKDLPKNSCFVAICYGYVNKSKNGIFIEYDPNNVGILDIPDDCPPEEFYLGRQVVVSIHKHKQNGFTARFINFV